MLKKLFSFMVLLKLSSYGVTLDSIDFNLKVPQNSKNPHFKKITIFNNSSHTKKFIFKTKNLKNNSPYQYISINPKSFILSPGKNRTISIKLNKTSMDKGIYYYYFVLKEQILDKNNTTNIDKVINIKQHFHII